MLRTLFANTYRCNSCSKWTSRVRWIFIDYIASLRKLIITLCFYRHGIDRLIMDAVRNLLYSHDVCWCKLPIWMSKVFHRPMWYMKLCGWLKSYCLWVSLIRRPQMEFFMTKYVNLVDEPVGYFNLLVQVLERVLQAMSYESKLPLRSSLSRHLAPLVRVYIVVCYFISMTVCHSAPGLTCRETFSDALYGDWKLHYGAKRFRVYAFHGDIL